MAFGNFGNVISVALMAGGFAVTHAATTEIKWSQLPPLPPFAGQAKQPGVASPFVGVHGDALIVAGGANFPDKMPWDGGAKVWWDTINVLENATGGTHGEATARWVAGKTFTLPRRLGYGVSVSTPEGVVCAGGSDAERCYAEVFLLSWDARTKELRRVTLPSMPEPLANMAGALVGDTLFVAGGQHVMKNATASSAFWALDLSARDRPADFKWQVLPTWPGAPRVLAVAAAQRSSRGEEFFLFSGRVPQPGQPTKLLADGYAFDPKTRTWRTLAHVGGGAGRCVMAGTAAAAGENEILIFGGDRGKLFLELEAHDLAVEALRRKLGAGDVAANERVKLEREIEEHLGAKRKIYGEHPGFSREVLRYDVSRDAWRVVTRAPVELPVTTTAVRWGDEVVIPSGEVRPGVRTANIIRVLPARR
jgi:cyclically-permuted mutarotase family protein